MTKLDYSYSAKTLKDMFDGKRVSSVLDFAYNADTKDIIKAIGHISVSGVQEKLSAIVSEGKIIIAPKGMQGRYIIKPAPSDNLLRFRQQIPANEHLTMAIAKQVYKIKTAENALVFFNDGYPAYITKRFDIAADGYRIPQEDFAALAGKTVANNGANFKYTGSYEDAAKVLREHVSAYQVEMSRFFMLVVFNYLFSNGDAHLKNFSLAKTLDGDYMLSPAYDLLNTSLHIDDTDFALEGGLMPKSAHSEAYRVTGHPCKDDFKTFGERIGSLPKKTESIITLFATEQPEVYELIEHSLLDDKAKRIYKRSYQRRLKRFQRSNKVE